MTVRDTAFLSSITIDPKTYNNKVFLTFDIDWAPDFVANVTKIITERPFLNN